MTFNTPAPFIERVMRFGMLNYKDGSFFAWGTPCFISPLFTFATVQRYFEKENGTEKTKDMLYALGKFQCTQAYMQITKKFGYVDTEKEREKFMKFFANQSDAAGFGQWEWTRIDFKNKLFIIKGKSNIALEYKKIYGVQEKPIDHFVRAEFETMMEIMLKEEMASVETSCIANGKSYCEFVIRPLKDWKKEELAGFYSKANIDPIKLGSKKENLA